MAQSTKLFTLPPTTVRGVGTHKQTIETLIAKSFRGSSMESAVVITDSLTDRTGAPIINQSFLLFDESASQASPAAGQGRVWVRNDTPSKLVFTNDTGITIPLTPALSDVLQIGTNAGNQEIVNVSRLNFNAGIEIGNANASATTASSNEIAIGQNAVSNAQYSVVIGKNASSTNQYAVCNGYSCIITAVAPNANDEGGVAVGSSIHSYGPGICVGRAIQNLVTNQDAGNANIFIGQNITMNGSQGGAIAIGNSAVPAPLSVVIGANAQSLGSERQVCIGNAASVGSKYSVAVGDSSSCSVIGDLTGGGYGVAIGALAVTTKIRAIALGYQSHSYGTDSLAIGANTLASGDLSIAIGGGAVNAAEASGLRSIAIGTESVAAFTDSTAIGASVETRISDEFATRGSRIVRSSLQTTDSTPSVILSYPTVIGDVLHVEATLIAMRADNDKSYMAVFERFHFRNKTGATANQSLGTGTISADTTDLALPLPTIAASSNNIRLEVTGLAATTLNWTCVMRLYATPLA
jgi:hypothetical protein